MEKDLFGFLKKRRENRDYSKQAIVCLQEMCEHLDITGKSPGEKRFYRLMKKIVTHAIQNKNSDLLEKTEEIGAAYLQAGARAIRFSITTDKRNSQYKKEVEEINTRERELDKKYEEDKKGIEEDRIKVNTNYRNDLGLERIGIKKDLEALLKTHGFEPKPPETAPAEPEKKPYATPELKRLDREQVLPQLSRYDPDRKTDPKGATKFVPKTEKKSEEANNKEKGGVGGLGA